MYTLHITFKNGKTFPIDFYGLDTAIECGKDHLRAPDVNSYKVTAKDSAITISEGKRA